MKLRQQQFPTRAGIPALTGLRFLAAFYVVISHGLPWVRQHIKLSGLLIPLLGNGPLAVALFFLLSGFLLSFTYKDNLSSTASFVTFWVARLARIYPVYLLSLLLALPFQLQLAFSARLAVLTTTQAWNPFHQEWAGAWNYPAWSLSVETFFYVLFPLLQRGIFRLSNKGLLILIAFTALACVVGHTAIQSIGERYDFPAGSSFIVLPLVRLPEFVLGMSLGNHFLRGTNFLNCIYLTYISATAALILLSFPIGSWVSLVVLPFAALIYGLASSRSTLSVFLSARIMVLLGGASYSVYLLQAPFRDWVRTIAVYALGNKAALVTPLTPLLLVIFSIVVFKRFEEPLRKLIKG